MKTYLPFLLVFLVAQPVFTQDDEVNQRYQLDMPVTSVLRMLRTQHVSIEQFNDSLWSDHKLTSDEQRLVKLLADSTTTGLQVTAGDEVFMIPKMSISGRRYLRNFYRGWWNMQSAEDSLVFRLSRFPDWNEFYRLIWSNETVAKKVLFEHIDLSISALSQFQWDPDTYYKPIQALCHKLQDRYNDPRLLNWLYLTLMEYDENQGQKVPDQYYSFLGRSQVNKGWVANLSVAVDLLKFSDFNTYFSPGVGFRSDRWYAGVASGLEFAKVRVDGKERPLRRIPLEMVIKIMPLDRGSIFLHTEAGYAFHLLKDYQSTGGPSFAYGIGGGTKIQWVVKYRQFFVNFKDHENRSVSAFQAGFTINMD